MCVFFQKLLRVKLTLVKLFFCASLRPLDPSLKVTSAKSRFRTLTLPVQQGAVTVGSTRPVKRVVSRRSGSGGRTPEATATPLRTDHQDTSPPTCPRDTVSLALSRSVTALRSVRVDAKLAFRFDTQSNAPQCRARSTSSTRRRGSAPGTTLEYHGKATALV